MIVCDCGREGDCTVVGECDCIEMWKGNVIVCDYVRGM